MNTAYKHLDSKLKLGELTIGQWFGLLAGISLGIVWGLYLSPFGEHLTVFTSVYVAALPVGAVLMASASELDLALAARSAMRWWRHEGRYVPGPGDSRRGYVVRSKASGAEDGRRQPYAIDLASLWDE